MLYPLYWSIHFFIGKMWLKAHAPHEIIEIIPNQSCCQEYCCQGRTWGGTKSKTFSIRYLANSCLTWGGRTFFARQKIFAATSMLALGAMLFNYWLGWRWPKTIVHPDPCFYRQSTALRESKRQVEAIVGKKEYMHIQTDTSASNCQFTSEC